jgi:hypothetical protein
MVFHTSHIISRFTGIGLHGSFVRKIILRIIPAMPDAEIDTGRFQMRRKGFHCYYFFLWRNKNYNREY